MSVAGQVVMSAAIGGTAEALGGGKFANGAVTGAYVMMFNHMGRKSNPEPTGIKFYDEQGNLIYNTNKEGAENRIYVIRDKYQDDFSYHVLERSNNYLSYITDNNYELFELIGSVYGREFFPINPDVKTNHLLVRGRQSFGRTVLMWLHFAGEGAAAGYMGGRAYERQYQGLQYHYNMQFGARQQWLDYVRVKTFEPWW